MRMVILFCGPVLACAVEEAPAGLQGSDTFGSSAEIGAADILLPLLDAADLVGGEVQREDVAPDGTATGPLDVANEGAAGEIEEAPPDAGPPGPCSPNPCRFPPPGRICEGDRAGSPTPTGTCEVAWVDAFNCHFGVDATGESTDCALLGETCAGGRCVPKGEPIDYVFQNPVAMLSELRVVPDPRYDFDGDGAPDNGMGATVALFGQSDPTKDLNALIASRIAIGLIRLVAEDRGETLTLTYGARYLPLVIPSSEFFPGTRTPRLTLVVTERTATSIRAEGPFELAWTTDNGRSTLVRLDHSLFEGVLDADGRLASATIDGWISIASLAQAVHDAAQLACPCHLGQQVGAVSSVGDNGIACSKDVPAIAESCAAAGDAHCQDIAENCLLFSFLAAPDLVDATGTHYGLSAGVAVTFTSESVAGVGL